MFSIVYASKGQVCVFAGRVKIVSHSSCRTCVLLKYLCSLVSFAIVLITAFVKLLRHINWSPMDQFIFKRSYHMRFKVLIAMSSYEGTGADMGRFTLESDALN